jgi:hypothetical protein
MGSLYLGQDRVGLFGLDVSRSGYGCECMGWLNLGQDMGVRVCVGCI